MKKFLLITVGIIVTPILLLIAFIIACRVFIPPKPPTRMDCLEFGYCKEGEQIILNGEKVTINEEYCRKHHLYWNKEYKYGDIRDKIND